MSTTEEYLDGLLQETMGQKESDTKTAQPDIPKEEKNVVPADDNHKMSPDEIAALFAQMQGDSEPAVEPEPVSEPEPVAEPVNEAVEDVTESQQPEPVIEQEPEICYDEKPAEIPQSEPETETESVKNAEESDMSDELSALLKEIQAEPDEDESQAESDADENAETSTEEKQPPQEHI